MKHFLLTLWTVVFLSLFAGAAIFVLFVMTHAWKYMGLVEAASWFRNFGSLMEGVMLPLEIIPLILSGILFLRLRKASSPASHMWLWVNCLNVATLASFFIYFLPVNVAFIDNTIHANEIAGELQRWQIVHAFRTLAIVLAVIIAMRAFRRQTMPQSSVV